MALHGIAADLLKEYAAIFKKRQTNVLLVPRCHRLELQSSPSPHAAAVEPVCPTERNHKKKQTNGETSWQAAPRVATSSNCRATTVQRSQSLVCTLRRFLRNRLAALISPPRSLFSSSAGREILNEPVRSGATRVRLADRAGAPAITCRGRSAGVKGGVGEERRGEGGREAVAQQICGVLGRGR